MNNIILFLVLPGVITFVLCQGYGYGNYGGGQFYGGYNGYNGYSNYGYSGYGQGGKGVALNNVVYYPQLTPYYTPYGNDQEIDPLVGLLGFLLLLYAFNISGINTRG